MVAMRDPLAVTVSLFFFEQTRLLPREAASVEDSENDGVDMTVHQQRAVEDLEEFVSRMLRTMCMWIALRYILWGEALSDQSMLFWYEDTLANPLQWHQDWLHLAGIQLPPSVIQVQAEPGKKIFFRLLGDAPLIILRRELIL